ncbi:TadE family protein [Catenulispora rubra]|uniref:TadE family protein n=1 Tax=Catenulispora rubra TaxID=280293 RepID=UPI0018924712|nr:TadE family protein [Catenulispora rubra]
MTSRDREEGSAAVEMVVATPLLILVVLFTVGLGRVTEAQMLAETAAGSAARAASLARSADQAVVAAHATVQANSSVSCPNPNVIVDTSAFRPGGTVAVTVDCHPRLADITGVGFPGTVQISERMVSGIDTWRQSDAP